MKKSKFIANVLTSVVLVASFALEHFEVFKNLAVFETLYAEKMFFFGIWGLYVLVTLVMLIASAIGRSRVMDRHGFQDTLVFALRNLGKLVVLTAVAYLYVQIRRINYYQVFFLLNMGSLLASLTAKGQYNQGRPATRIARRTEPQGESEAPKPRPNPRTTNPVRSEVQRHESIPSTPTFRRPRLNPNESKDPFDE